MWVRLQKPKIPKSQLHHVGAFALAVRREAIARGAHRAGVLAVAGAGFAAVDDAGAANATLHVLKDNWDGKPWETIVFTWKNQGKSAETTYIVI